MECAKALTVKVNSVKAVQNGSNQNVCMANISNGILFSTTMPTITPPNEAPSLGSLYLPSKCRRIYDIRLNKTNFAFVK